jgi:hypothetical protein
MGLSKPQSSINALSHTAITSAPAAFNFLA